jgi:hypothetical protein
MLIHNAAITGSLTYNGIDISDITGSEASVASLNSFSSSILSYTASNNTNINALQTFSSSILTYTASNDSINTTQNNRLSSLETTSGSLLIASGSFSTRVTDLETASGSFSTRVSNTETTSSNLTTASSSFSTRVANNESTGSSLVAASASFSTRVTNNESNISSLTTASGSFSTRTTNLETASGSFSTRVTNAESNITSLNSKTGSYATTGSNTLVGAQYISNISNAISFTSTGSLYTDGGMRVAKDMYVSGTAYFNNVTVFGTQSIAYISSSQLNIGTNIISVNTDTPSIRFGGLAVYDSGSTGLTGSMLWDSEDNQWIYSNPSGSTYDSAVFLVGPRNSGAIGSEVGISCNFLSKGNGMHHMTSSAIFENGSRTCFYGTSFISSSGVACFAGNTTIGGDLNVGNASTTSSITITGTSVGGFTAGYIGWGAGNQVTTGLYINSPGTNIEITTGFNERVALSTGTGLQVYTNNGSGAYTSRMLLDRSGNVCFSGNACASSLTTSGDITTGGNVNLSNDKGIFIKRADGTLGQALFLGSGNELNIGFGVADVIRFATYLNNERLRITSTGIACFSCQVCAPNVTISNCLGVGVTSPQGNFEVSGLSYFTRANNSFLINPNYGGAGTHTQLQVGCNMALAFATCGDNERMRITSDGVVGIGTNAPVIQDGNLVVAGCVGTGQGAANTVAQINIWETTSVNKSGLWFGSMTNANTGVIGSRTATGNIAFQTYCGAWAERMRITYNGNVGIGVTPSAWALGTTLQIGGDNSAINYSGVAAILGIINAYWNGSSYIVQNTGTQASFEYGLARGSAFNWRMGASACVGSTTPLGVVMSLSSNGNLSVGNTNDTYKLDVTGTGRFTGQVNSETAFYAVATPPATNGGLINVRDTVTATNVTSFAGVFFNSAPGSDYSIGKLTENNAGFLQIRNANNGTELLRINTSGVSTFSSNVCALGLSLTGASDAVLNMTAPGATAYITFKNACNSNWGVGASFIGRTCNLDVYNFSTNCNVLTIDKTGVACFNGTICAPNAVLNCLGAGAAWSTSGGTYQPIQIKSGLANSGLWVESCADDSGLYINHISAGAVIGSSYRASAGYKDLILQTAGSTRITIKCAGNVGINCTSPGQLLTVNGISSFKGHQQHPDGQWYKIPFYLEKGNASGTPRTFCLITIDNNDQFQELHFTIEYGSRLQGVSDSATQTSLRTYGVNRFVGATATVNDVYLITGGSGCAINTHAPMSVAIAGSCMSVVKVDFSSSVGGSSFVWGEVRIWSIEPLAGKITVANNNY